ncbi:MAG: hypothetical protein KJO91_06275 [Gammaproteobacteria bacterium]|nr:hypothetical protein [Gammaproteobacteria bacterium]
MEIGVPKEIKNHEYRIGFIPSGVEARRSSAMAYSVNSAGNRLEMITA